jgi:hypothetical protein
MMFARGRRTAVLLAGLLLGACAGPRRPTETAATARLKDSAPEKVAAQRAAAPGLKLEDDDQRWGIAAAKERKQRRDDERARNAATKTFIPGTAGVEVAPAPLPPAR